MIRLISTGVPTATEQSYTYEIVEKLCKQYCVNQGIQPIVNVAFNVSDSQTVGTQVYATVQAVVTVTYQQAGSKCNCGACTNTFVEEFQLSAEGSAISVSGVDGFSEPAYISTNSCGKAQGIRKVGVLTATITA